MVVEVKVSNMADEKDGEFGSKDDSCDREEKNRSLMSTAG